MKKTIATVAMIVSSQAALGLGFERPTNPPPKKVNVCLSVSEGRDGSKYGGCDETSNNAITEAKLLENGCAEKQVALKFIDKSPIEACMPPGMIQL